jgi:hypothetical protein
MKSWSKLVSAYEDALSGKVLKKRLKEKLLVQKCVKEEINRLIKELGLD